MSLGTAHVGDKVDQLAMLKTVSKLLTKQGNHIFLLFFRIKLENVKESFGMFVKETKIFMNQEKLYILLAKCKTIKVDISCE